MGMPTERAGYMLPAVIPEFKKQYPGIELQVMEAKSDELLQAILRDDISFYVIPRSQRELPVGLKAEPIYREQLLLVAEESMLTEDMFLDESCVSNLTEGKRKNRCVNLSKTVMPSICYVEKMVMQSVKRQILCCGNMALIRRL